MGWGVAFFDADRDGQLDLFFANGHLFPQVDRDPELGESYHQKNQLLINQGGRFRDISEIAGGGLGARKSSRGLAIGDLDNDGNLDLVITNMDDVPTVLQNRTKTLYHWAGFQLKKEGKNRFCIGAKIMIDAGGKKQMREVRSGGSYLSQNDLRAYFGLGSYDGKLNVEIRMPGGIAGNGKACPPIGSLLLYCGKKRRSGRARRRSHFEYNRGADIHVCRAEIRLGVGL